ncbi:MAG: family 43 glycosylhydrolase [Ruminococcus sp.]|nr:family 43 glycosylhydrolase [Ruminococcus sp.]
MNFKKKLSRLLSGAVSGAMLFSVASVIPTETQTGIAPQQLDAEAAGACTINTNKTYQRIRGFGGMNHPEWQSYNAQNGAPGDMTAAQVQTAFGNGANELGLTILRIFVSDQQNAWNNAIPTAQRASALGATVFATPWNPPASMRSNGSGGPRGGQYVLNNGAEANYAKHLNDFIKFCNSKGVELNSISVQNEPDWSGEWTYWAPSRCASFLANYGPTVTAGTNTKMMSPESFSYSKDYYNAILNDSKAFANCDMFGTHFYGTQRSAMDFPALESCGKEIWMTEVYVPNSDANSADRWPEGVQVAENIHNAMVVGNMNAYVWWYIRRQYSPMWDTGKISKRGYAMAQFSKWVRPGDMRIDATEQPNSGILVSAYKHSDTQATIVAINNSKTDVTQQFTLSGRNITNVDRYRTSGSENIAQTKGMEANGESFYAQLPASSVSTFVVTMTSDGKGLPADTDGPTPKEPITPDSNGYYYHDTFEGSTDDWEGRGGATTTLSGRIPYADKEALLIQDRSSAWNGVMKSLDSATFKAGDTYSFSVVAATNGSSANMMLSLQYTDASGETKYDHIASANSITDTYVQLANPNYKLPEGSNYILYVETESGTDNFYIDEAIVAKAGTQIDGPEEVKPVTIIPGDTDFDGSVTAFDLIIARKGIVNGFTDKNAEKAADVDQSGKFEVNDLVSLSEFLLGKIKDFPVAEKPVPQIDLNALAQKFGTVNLATAYKKDNEHNPLIAQYFGADPGVMEYNGRVYIYMTDDHLLYSNGQVTKETYSTINCLRCISSDDLVNWTDHGLINAAGQNGIAKWAGNSWAPTAAHKTINGKEKFFLYFANNANGIGVLTSDSPTGPWSDPNGRAMIDRKTAGCTDVPWVFDPAVLVDDDGKGYLYFGGGTENLPSDHPKSARCVALSDNMTSIVGTPTTIDAPYMFEDSGIHKFNGKYYYSYCTNWSTNGNQYGLTTAAIDYMVSDNPLGPFTHKGEVFKNIGNFFGTTGNNHHTIMKFKDQWYLFYHAQYLQDNMNLNGMGYRSTHIDKITMNSDGTMQQVKGTKTGVDQIKSLDPFTPVRAATFSHEGGIEITGSGNSLVKAEKGDWFRVSGVDCKSAQTLTVKASSANGCVMKVCKGSASGTAVTYVEIPAGGSMQEITVPVVDLSGKNDLYFVFNNAASVDSWQLS